MEDNNKSSAFFNKILITKQCSSKTRYEMNLLSVVVFSLWLSIGNAYNILGIFPFRSKSHFAIGNGVMNSLLDAGHQITMVSPYPRTVETVNWRDISLMTEGDKIRIGVS